MSGGCGLGVKMNGRPSTIKAASVHNRNPFYALFTFTLFGAFLLVTDAIGWHPIKDGGAFLGAGRWVDGPIWSQRASD